jgi:uncharacterized membrane protein YidH (DUF202 family)
VLDADSLKTTPCFDKIFKNGAQKGGLMAAKTNVEKSEQEILAKIRTLLALERNYLAEERTELAEFRTGLAVTVIAPAASTFIAYIFSLLQVGYALLFDALNFTFFTILTVWGTWTSLRSRSRLNKIRKKKMILKHRECEVIRKSKAVQDLLGECITSEDVKTT